MSDKIADRAPMWRYWVEQHGSPAQALRRQYQEIVGIDHRLATAIEIIEMAEARIDQIMKEHGL